VIIWVLRFAKQVRKSSEVQPAWYAVHPQLDISYSLWQLVV
jgi:hypothetical protein